MLQNKETEANHANRVRQMFASIAGRYDLLNHILSANVDKRWRWHVVNALGRDIPEGALVLDVACGTGDLSLAIKQGTKARVIAIDFCRPMLRIAAKKSRSASVDVTFIEGDALRLPFCDDAFQAVTIAFGLRNLANVEEGLRELRRVIKPGGKLAILEFSSPIVPGFNALFKLYFKRILPVLGGFISGSKIAYEYLPESVSRFPNQEALASMMRKAGFGEVRCDNLTWGIASAHYGKRIQFQ